VFAFRICVTFLFFQSKPEIGTAVTVAFGLSLFTAALGVAMVSPAVGERPVRHSRTTAWIWFYLFLVLMSLSWTTTRSITNAAAYWLALAADVVTVAVLMWHGPVQKQACGLMKGFVIGGINLAIIAWVIPALSDLRLGDEDFLHPNAIGYQLAIATLFALYLSRHSHVWIWMAGLLGITLLRTLSKASIIACLAAGLFYIVSDSSLRRRSKRNIGIAVALLLVLSWGLLESYIDTYAQGGRVETLTGRTVIWAEAYSTALEKPWFGHGFYSFRWVVPLFGDFEAWQAHNELLQQFFSYGLVGVVVVIVLYRSLYLDVRLARGTSQHLLAAALLIFALVRGLVDTERFDLTYPLWLMAMMSIWISRTRLTVSTVHE